MPSQTGQDKTIFEALLMVCDLDGVTPAARALILASAIEAVYSDKPEPTAKVSRSSARRLAGLSRYGLDNVFAELESLTWIEVTKGQRMTPRLNFILADISAKIGSEVIFDLGRHISQEGQTDDSTAKNDLGRHIGQEGQRSAPESKTTAKNDLGRHIGQEGQTDDSTAKNDLGRHIGQEGASSSNDLGRHISQDRAPSRAHTRPPPPQFITVSSGRAQTREADALDYELDKLDKVDAVRAVVERTPTSTAETIDAYILETCAAFGRKIGIPASLGLASNLLCKLNKDELVREYVLERLIEHAAGDDSVSDKGFTSYLMQDAKRWLVSRSKDQARQVVSSAAPLLEAPALAHELTFEPIEFDQRPQQELTAEQRRMIDERFKL